MKNAARPMLTIAEGHWLQQVCRIAIEAIDVHLREHVVNAVRC